MKKFFTFISSLIILNGCSKSGSSNSVNFWHVKYEITSINPLAKATIVFRDETGAGVSIGTGGSPVILPWSYEKDWSKDAGLLIARSLYLNVISVNPYAAGDVTAKIYVDGTLVNQSNIFGALGISVTYQLQ